MNEPSHLQLPEGLLLYVHGAVRMGVPAGEIERHLIGKGISPEDANRLVMDLVEKHFAATARTLPRPWARPARLFLCTAIGAVCVGLAYSSGGWIAAPLEGVLPALFCIWALELTDMCESGWGARWWITSWAALLILLGYEIFIAAMLP